MLYREVSVIEAMQWHGDNFQELNKMLPERHYAMGQEAGRNQKTGELNTPKKNEVLLVSNPPHGQLWLKPGDWLVLKSNTVKVVGNDVFHTVYKPIQPEPLKAS